MLLYCTCTAVVLLCVAFFVRVCLVAHGSQGTPRFSFNASSLYGKHTLSVRYDESTLVEADSNRMAHNLICGCLPRTHGDQVTLGWPDGDKRVHTLPPIVDMQHLDQLMCRRSLLLIRYYNSMILLILLYSYYSCTVVSYDIDSTLTSSSRARDRAVRVALWLMDRE